jgi:hypothetical protein
VRNEIVFTLICWRGSGGSDNGGKAIMVEGEWEGGGNGFELNNKEDNKRKKKQDRENKN